MKGGVPMTKVAKGVILIIALLVFEIWLPKGSAEVLKIGMIASMSGPMAPGFKGMVDAVDATEKIINEMGGVSIKSESYSIKIVCEDDRSSPEGALAAAKRLISQNIKFMIAPLFIPSNMAITSLCEKHKVVRMTPICINPDVVAGNYCFFSNTTGKPNIETCYDYLLSKYPEIKKVAILIIDDPGVMPVKEWEKAEITKRGLEIVGEEAYPIPTEDFYPILTRLLKKEPDAIAGVTSAMAFAAAIVNQAREFGFKGPIYWSCGLGDIRTAVDMIRPEFRYGIISGLPDVTSVEMPRLVKRLGILMKESGHPFTFDATLTLDCAYNLIQAINKAQSLDVDKIVETIENMNSMDTIYGKALVTGGKEFGCPPRHMILEPRWFSEVDGGKISSWMRPVVK